MQEKVNHFWLKLIATFLCCVRDACSSTVVKPCTNMTVTTDLQFLRNSLYNMHSNTESYFKHDVAQQCKLHFVDIFKVEPPRGNKNVWIVYMGDSIGHDLYHAAVQRLTGYNPSVNKNDVIHSFMGNHLGPQNEEEVNLMKYSSNPEYLVCCRAWGRIKINDGDESHANECIMAASNRGLNGNKEIAEKNRMFLFEEAAVYIKNFVSPLYFDNYKCISFSWAPTIWDAADAVWRFNKGTVQPQAVIMNMGTHIMHTLKGSIQEVAPALNNLMQATAANTIKTRYLLHSATSSNAKKVHDNAVGMNEKITRYNTYIQSRLKEWDTLDVYMDFWAYDIILSSVSGCKKSDGIHFERWCNYQPLLSQWDFNWLVSLGVISDGNEVTYNKATN